jgi:hypothetical protein
VDTSTDSIMYYVAFKNYIRILVVSGYM